MSWEDALAGLARPVGLVPAPSPTPLDALGGAWYVAPWGVLWAVPVSDVTTWPTLQALLVEGLSRYEAATGRPEGALEAWMVLLADHVPTRRVRQAAQLDVRVCRKHVVWAGAEGWAAALGAVTCLALPPAQPIRMNDVDESWLAELADLNDRERAAALRERLADVERGP